MLVRGSKRFGMLKALILAMAAVGMVGVNAHHEHVHGHHHHGHHDHHHDSLTDEKLSHHAHAHDKIWSLEELQTELQSCQIVKDVLHHRKEEHHSGGGGGGGGSGQPDVDSTYLQLISEYLFPLGPAGNSLLATAYISGPPNLILALVPPDIDPSRLSIMVAFAVGGLLGDTLLHLVPGSFVGEVEGGGSEGGEGGVRVVVNSDKRNLLVGTMVMVGFAAFVAMEKALRVMSIREGGKKKKAGGHGHSHSHSHSGQSNGKTTGREGAGGELRKRNGKAAEGEGEDEEEEEEEEEVKEVKVSSYLNIFADFSHNITDGLALSAAFYASPTLGITTTISVFFHEIPHEIGDFALLVQSGFTKWEAMSAQFFTAIGAFMGTFIGIAIQHYGAASPTDKVVGWDQGIWGTGLGAGDLVLPFTAGTFLYVGFSAVPELLEVGDGGRLKETLRGVGQLIAMAAGFGIMFLVS
ncbi:ZIP zinc transporter-domain-containing protein [Peziza echinospora]|nr:ZIP zinc transporter-domain-containing protein [Peziza echinospora]